MRLYLEIARQSFRRAMVYRGAYLAGMVTNAFFGAVRSFVYIALYAAGQHVAGFSLQDAISYTWTTQALISIGAGWVSWDINNTIRSGEVITDLGRPWSFYGYWFSRTVGGQVFNLIVRGVLTYSIGVMLFGARVPDGSELAGFLVAVVLSIIVSFAYTFIINSTAFWLVDSTGVIIIGNVLLSFFSGMLVPIRFFPPMLAALAQALPFQAITGLPAEVLLGQVNGSALLEVFAIQLFWAVVLTIGAHLLLRAAMHKVVIQGG